MLKSRIEYVREIYSKYSNAHPSMFDHTEDKHIPKSMIDILKDVEELNKHTPLNSDHKPIGAVRLYFTTFVRYKGEVYLISPTTKFLDVLLYRLKDGKAVFLPANEMVEVIQLTEIDATLTGKDVVLDRKVTKAGTVFYHKDSDSLILKVEEVASLGSDTYPYSYCVHFINLMTGEDYRETTKFILDNPILPTVEIELKEVI